MTKNSYYVAFQYRGDEYFTIRQNLDSLQTFFACYRDEIRVRDWFALDVHGTCYAEKKASFQRLADRLKYGPTEGFYWWEPDELEYWFNSNAKRYGLQKELGIA